MPLPVHVLPDAELAVTGYLRSALAGRAEQYAAGVRVGRLVDPDPPPFVAVRRVGGQQASPAHDRARVDVLVWHRTDVDRMALALLCRALLAAAAGDPAAGVRVTFAAEFTGPRRFPDPADPNRQIVLFTHELYLR